ncbi:hypothetical protein HWV62_31049 [Athelia sp. TMB]|nr:hypothetical protein HWV62_31049 [Athelia sp. TMB]
MATFNTIDAAARAKVNNYGGSRTIIANGLPNPESADVPLPGPANGGSTQPDVNNFYRDLAATVRAMDPAVDMGAMEAQVEPSSLDQQRPPLRWRRTIPQIFSQFAYALRLRRPTTSRRSAHVSQTY